MGDSSRLNAHWFAPRPEGQDFSRAGFNPESVAAVLRNTRILSGYGDIGEVAAVIKVRRNYLEAIEDRRFHDLPEIVYATGFVAAYAKFLGLNVDEMVAKFKAEAEDKDHPPAVTAPVRRASAAAEGQRASESKLPTGKLLVGAMLAALVMFGAWQIAGTEDRAEALAVPPLPAALKEPVAELPPPPPPAPVVAPEVVAPAAPRFLLKAVSDEAAVEIYAADGRRLAGLSLRDGETYTLPQVGPLRIVTTTPDGLQVLAAEKIYSLPTQEKGRTEVWIDPARLLALATAGQR